MPKFKPHNPRGFDCVNVLVQRAIGKVKTKAKNRDRERKRNDANPELNRSRVKCWREENKQRKKSMDKRYYTANKRKVQSRQRVYYANNSAKINKTIRQKRMISPKHLTAMRLRSRLGVFLRSKKMPKHSATFDLVGKSAADVHLHLQQQLRPGDDYRKCQIDHIFSVQCYKDVNDQKKMMHWSNLQPLTAEENRSKSDKLPTKAMAAKVARSAWPDGVTEDMLPDIYDGWATPLRMEAASSSDP